MASKLPTITKPLIPVGWWRRSCNRLPWSAHLATCKAVWTVPSISIVQPQYTCTLCTSPGKNMAAGVRSKKLLMALSLVKYTTRSADGRKKMKTWACPRWFHRLHNMWLLTWVHEESRTSRDSQANHLENWSCDNSSFISIDENDATRSSVRRINI